MSRVVASTHKTFKTRSGANNIIKRIYGNNTVGNFVVNSASFSRTQGNPTFFYLFEGKLLRAMSFDCLHAAVRYALVSPLSQRSAIFLRGRTSFLATRKFSGFLFFTSERRRRFVRNKHRGARLRDGRHDWFSRRSKLNDDRKTVSE